MWVACVCVCGTHLSGHHRQTQAEAAKRREQGTEATLALQERVTELELEVEHSRSARHKAETRASELNAQLSLLQAESVSLKGNMVDE